MAQPVEALAGLLDHLSGAPRERPALADAVWLARREHLEAIESELGRSLDGTRIDRGSTASARSRRAAPTPASTSGHAARRWRSSTAGGSTSACSNGRCTPRKRQPPPPSRHPLAHTGRSSPLASLQSPSAALEAEAIHILREAAAEFRNPVLLYSIGKDSSVLLHLASKAFHPAKPPFPLLHVDTTWKFREMIALPRRRRGAARPAADRAHQPRRRGARHRPVRHGAARPHRRHEDRGAEAGARPARLRRRHRRRAARRGEVAREGAHLLAPQRQPSLGSEAASGRSCGTSTTRASRRARACACFRCRTGPSSTSGTTSRARTFPSCRSISRQAAAGGRARRRADHGRRRAPAAAPGESPEMRRCASARSAAIR